MVVVRERHGLRDEEEEEKGEEEEEEEKKADKKETAMSDAARGQPCQMVSGEVKENKKRGEENEGEESIAGRKEAECASSEEDIEIETEVWGNEEEIKEVAERGGKKERGDELVHGKVEARGEQQKEQQKEEEKEKGGEAVVQGWEKRKKALVNGDTDTRPSSPAAFPNGRPSPAPLMLPQRSPQWAGRPCLQHTHTHTQGGQVQTEWSEALLSIA